MSRLTRARVACIGIAISSLIVLLANDSGLGSPMDSSTHQYVATSLAISLTLALCFREVACNPDQQRATHLLVGGLTGFVGLGIAHLIHALSGEAILPPTWAEDVLALAASGVLAGAITRYALHPQSVIAAAGYALRIAHEETNAARTTVPPDQDERRA